MQLKESKTNSHFFLSIFKSLIRLVGYTLLFYNIIDGAAFTLIIAEGIGILEEL